jgi:hypothetical protein
MFSFFRVWTNLVIGFGELINPLMLELNPSAQCCLIRFFTGDFAS